MTPRIEFGKLIDSIEDLGDELAEKPSRRDTRAATETASNGAGEIGQIPIVYNTLDALGCGSLFGKQIADPRTDGSEGLKIEPSQADLHGTGIVEARPGGEVGVQTLGEGRKPLNALRPFKRKPRSR